MSDTYGNLANRKVVVWGRVFFCQAGFALSQYHFPEEDRIYGCWVDTQEQDIIRRRDIERLEG
jgi:hypothetical protein